MKNIQIIKAWVAMYIDNSIEKFMHYYGLNNTVDNQSNKLFYISALGFFLLNTNFQRQFLGVIIAYFFFKYFSNKVGNIQTYVNKSSVVLRFFCITSALGVVIGEWQALYSTTTSKLLKAANVVNVLEYIDIPFIFASVCFVFAWYFAYCLLVFFWNQLHKIIEETGIFKELKIYEIVIYSVLTILSITYMAYAFMHSNAFYSYADKYDLIYTSDTIPLFKNNVYVYVSHAENDFRQPLFAFFSAPFIGISYLISFVFNLPLDLKAILVNIPQIILMHLATIILCKTIKLKAHQRICMFIVFYCTYTQMLFSIMLEQYVVGYFWLMLSIYCIVNNYRDRMALWGAAGTLITNLALVPFALGSTPWKKLKNWLYEIKSYILEFVLIVIALSRIDIFLKFFGKVSLYTSFSGENINFIDKFYQYTEFIHNYFLLPNAGEMFLKNDGYIWRLYDISAINMIGVTILVIALLWGIFNIDEKSSCISIAWIGLSFLLLVILGWGTKENGLILYELYFGWPFLVLIVQLIARLEKAINTRLLFPIVTIVFMFLCLENNIVAINELVNFAVTYYPN